MFHYDLDHGSIFGIAELNLWNTIQHPNWAESLEYHTAPKPACSKTWSLWIPFPTTQNHILDVSSELGWLRSNGLGVMLHYDLDQGSKFGIAEHCVVGIPLHPNRTAQRHMEPMDPLPNHPKPCLGCIK
jgi:hypothetical protein